MKVLDCETVECIYASVERILGVERSGLDSVFDSIDLKVIYETTSPRIPPTQYLLSEIVNRISPKSMSFDRICWFHLTRTAEGNEFNNGILPLNQCIDSIWDFLYELLDGKLSKHEWCNFRSNEIMSGNSHWSYLYSLKTANRVYWGPYAQLIQDIAFRSDELNHHDYFRAPEIIEDICIVLQECHGIDLLPIFAEKTRPCIVKFVDDDAKSYCLEAALCHLYHLRKGDSCAPVSPCTTGFDGKGKEIPKNRILKIEFPNYP